MIDSNVPVRPGVPLLDINRENESIREELRSAIDLVITSGQFVLGPACQRLEKAIAAACDVKHAIGCASGSEALLLSLMAHDVGPGDEVIVPSFTFFATASAVWRLGARPVFADIDPVTFNIDTSHAESLVTPRTKALIAVHLYGLCADMDRLQELAAKHDLALIEDAAQSLGASYHGRKAGSMSNIACFSFYPTKNLGGWGEGGMLTTSDDRLADRLRLLRTHGMRPRYYHQEVGINSRLNSLQAAVLHVKLRYYARWNARRVENANRYQQLFEKAGLHKKVVIPRCLENMTHIWNQYTIRVPAAIRDELRTYLKESNIGTEIYYPVPLHRQECFRSLGCPQGSLPETERAATEVLSLPIFPMLTEAEQQTVVQRIAEFYRKNDPAPRHEQATDYGVFAGESGG